MSPPSRRALKPSVRRAMTATLEHLQGGQSDVVDRGLQKRQAVMHRIFPGAARTMLSVRTLAPATLMGSCSRCAASREFLIDFFLTAEFVICFESLAKRSVSHQHWFCFRSCEFVCPQFAGNRRSRRLGRDHAGLRFLPYRSDQLRYDRHGRNADRQCRLRSGLRCSIPAKRSSRARFCRRNINPA